jgi:hypothetical protein
MIYIRKSAQRKFKRDIAAFIRAATGAAAATE